MSCPPHLHRIRPRQPARQPFRARRHRSCRCRQHRPSRADRGNAGVLCRGDGTGTIRCDVQPADVPDVSRRLRTARLGGTTGGHQPDELAGRRREYRLATGPSDRDGANSAGRAALSRLTGTAATGIQHIGNLSPKSGHHIAAQRNRQHRLGSRTDRHAARAPGPADGRRLLPAVGHGHQCIRRHHGHAASGSSGRVRIRPNCLPHGPHSVDFGPAARRSGSGPQLGPPVATED